jgi:hypothetical protein
MCIAVIALAPLLVSAGLFLYEAVTARDAGALIPAILIAAVMFPDVDPKSQVIEVFVLFAGVPLVSGVLLVIADFVLPVAGSEEYRGDVERGATTH